MGLPPLETRPEHDSRQSVERSERSKGATCFYHSADAAFLDHVGAMAGNAVADPVDAAQVLRVDVDELASALPLVADDPRLRVERG